jgi:hypothetical protein
MRLDQAFHSILSTLRYCRGGFPMRTAINTIANVTTSAIANRVVRTVVAGVDVLRASLHHQRLFAAPAPREWTYAEGQPFAGKQKPEGIGSQPGDSDLSRCMRRASSRCRRPRTSGCLARS